MEKSGVLWRHISSKKLDEDVRIQLDKLGKLISKMADAKKEQKRWIKTVAILVSR